MCKQYIFSKVVASMVLALGALSGSAVAQQPPPQQPSTSPTEGTAADRTRPGETPTKDAMPRPPDPRPSTSETEGTAADRTPPGQTRTTQDQATNRGAQRSEMVGAAVVAENQAPLGRVVDVVFDAANQPEFVVIQSAGKNTAVPYSVANANKAADKIVIDGSRLQGAPTIKQGEWRSESNKAWKKDAARYWERG